MKTTIRNLLVIAANNKLNQTENYHQGNLLNNVIRVEEQRLNNEGKQSLNELNKSPINLNDIFNLARIVAFNAKIEKSGVRNEYIIKNFETLDFNKDNPTVGDLQKSICLYFNLKSLGSEFMNNMVLNPDEKMKELQAKPLTYENLMLLAEYEDELVSKVNPSDHDATLANKLALSVNREISLPFLARDLAGEPLHLESENFNEKIIRVHNQF
ncbi:hypothetical protein L3V82_04015 [Thiotrichales bacterium 19S3-7]|nr:hypothetical protein [Thiotrichales bacterium 19S3-7]MCF6801840.1 hypothetical protein [Thiotrichales bacterium 19S3-11]